MRTAPARSGSGKRAGESGGGDLLVSRKSMRLRRLMMVIVSADGIGGELQRGASMARRMREGCDWINLRCFQRLVSTASLPVLRSMVSGEQMCICDSHFHYGYIAYGVIGHNIHRYHQPSVAQFLSHLLSSAHMSLYVRYTARINCTPSSFSQLSYSPHFCLLYSTNKIPILQSSHANRYYYVLGARQHHAFRVKYHQHEVRRRRLRCFCASS